MKHEIFSISTGFLAGFLNQQFGIAAGNSQIEAKQKKYVPKTDSFDGTAGTAGPSETWILRYGG